MKSNSLRFVLWSALLLLGFLAGAAWRNSDSDQQTEEPTASKTVNYKNEEATDEPPTEEAHGADRLNDSELATISLFEKAAPSVCFITTSSIRQDFWTRDIAEIPRGTGSGFIWDKQGHVVTNYHVIQGADRAKVTFADQSIWEASLVGVAPDKDLAVLKIDAAASQLRPIPVGRSDDLRVGQSVYAIGNPFGLDQTLTTGIVSALGREIESVSGIPIRDVIQTDAAINPGNSGGPLLNSSGELIGVNTAIYSPSGASAGIGFSIPVNVLRWVVPELIEYGEIKRPSMGIEVTPTNWIRRYQLDGPLVWEMDPNGAAARAGVRPTTRDRNGQIILGDIIVAMNKSKVTTYEDLILELEKYQPGDQITLTVLRNGKKEDIPLTLDKSK